MWWICNDNCITDFPQNVSVKELDCCYAPENWGGISSDDYAPVIVDYYGIGPTRVPYSEIVP